MTDLKLLIFFQICIDIGIVVAFVFWVKRGKQRQENPSFNSGLEIVEAVLSEAEKTAAQFSRQLEDKKQLIHKLNEQLDQKIMRINMHLNRADAILAEHSHAESPPEKPIVSNRLGEEIIRLAKEGRDLETIADMLSVPKGEVMLVLGLKKKIAQLGHDEGVS